jgi:hypothetical protein
VVVIDDEQLRLGLVVGIASLHEPQRYTAAGSFRAAARANKEFFGLGAAERVLVLLRKSSRTPRHAESKRVPARVGRM